MIMIGLKQAKANFFSTDAVKAKMDNATRLDLQRAGGIVRTIARRSMRRHAYKGKYEKGSPPGKPPYARTGLIRDMIFFSYDGATKKVVVGPTLINRPTGAPKILEFGGLATITKRRFRHRKGRNVLETTSRKLSVQARPFMGPALAEAKPRLAELWRNSIRS